MKEQNGLTKSPNIGAFHADSEEIMNEEKVLVGGLVIQEGVGIRGGRIKRLHRQHVAQPNKDNEAECTKCTAVYRLSFT
jgi:hypothetical protein